MEGRDTHQEYFMGPGSTPLAWAALYGHQEVVEILLGRDDINPNKPNKNGRTPLWCAAC